MFNLLSIIIKKVTVRFDGQAKPTKVRLNVHETRELNPKLGRKVKATKWFK